MPDDCVVFIYHQSFPIRWLLFNCMDSVISPAQSFQARMPAIPASLPSELLERRPDIAAAERLAAQANANIGVAKAAYYPALTLSASGAGGGATFASLFDTPSRIWALGATLAQTVFD